MFDDFLKAFPSLGKNILVTKKNFNKQCSEKNPGYWLSVNDVQKHCLDKVRVQEALTKYSNLNNKMIKSFESMEEAQELNDAWNTMIDELGI